MDINSFIIPEPSHIDSLKTALEEVFTALKETTERTRYTIYDTFDWRLHNNDRELIRKGSHYDLVHVSGGEVISTIDTGRKKEIRFCRDFPASDFANHLEQLLEMRALMPLAEIEKNLDRIAVCNADRKTVARIEFETLAITGNEGGVIRCRLLPMKGYDKEACKIRAIIEAQHLPLAETPGVIDLLRKSGIDPGAYSSKIDVTLQPEMPAVEAVRHILENLVTVMHKNLEGVRKDIDTEFLHDLRVAIRRARSLLGQIKGVLEEETAALLQKCLKTMGGVSGQVRDLDVYLLKKEAYVKKVPETLQPGILQLFHALKRKRSTARAHMLKLMDGRDYNDALETLDNFLQSKPVVHVGTPSSAPIGTLANTVIYKRFRRIVRRGGQISDESPDEKLHEVRIECKKLRYLLEFFTSLFPEDQMKKRIKQLKALQDNLGEFNDLSVQQEFLTTYLAAVKPAAPRSVMLAAAVGGLIASLRADQQRVRSEFLYVFEGFSSEENQAAFKTLFT